ncbi:hypothetical protein [Lysobacter enzymogenes]|uniref:hypothetical protein n=1 Tax=Lysobacter enzymogenes TaxID=69 RepID=UPI001A96386A|nr:hypothetical protein [Lysobacter enzymogenes]QQP98182.1 hypothetical protein JHW38_09400 [Lysobacter enzymogenes]
MGIPDERIEHYKSETFSDAGEWGWFYFEVRGQEIVRHVTVIGGTYRWADWQGSSHADYMFTEAPDFDAPAEEEKPITKEDFEAIWAEAGGPKEFREGPPGCFDRWW